MDEQKEWLWPGYPQEPGLGTTQIQKQIPTACRGMSYFLSTVDCELGPPALKPGTSHPETCQQASSKAFSSSLLSTFLSCVDAGLARAAAERTTQKFEFVKLCSLELSLVLSLG